MRKIAAWVLMGVGTFLLVAALVARFWGLPHAEKTPLNTDSQTFLSGEGSGLLVEGGEDGDEQPVRAVNTTKVDSEASTDDVAVFIAGTCVAVDEDIEGDQLCLGTPDDPDPRQITISAAPEDVEGDDPPPDVFATDRHTGEAVDNGDYVPAGYARKEGLINKWPFGAEKKDYQVWDDVLGETVTATYEGTERIDGLETYQYEYTVEDVETEIAAGQEGEYSQHKVYWVDPGTGAIIRQTQQEQRVLPTGEVAIQLDLAYTDETVQANVDAAKSNNAPLQLIGGWIPLVGGVLGVLALLIGILLFAFSGRSTAHRA